MTISLILAMAENGVIGRGGSLPWHLPSDLKRFRKLTTGHTILMGRKTFESIGKPLPERRNVVLTRKRGFRHDGIVVVHNLADALRSAGGEDELFVVGGAEVYQHTITIADRVYLTVVCAEIDGDTTFCEFRSSDWDLLEDEFQEPDAKHAHPLSFKSYIRRNKGPVP